MQRLVVKSRVDADGVLRVVIPVGAADADREVRVTIDAVAPPMTRGEWEHFVLSTAGSIPDPTFTRHPQGDYERREALP